MSVFQLQNKLLTIKVNSFGAELCSVVSADKCIEYIWQADESVWARHAPNLFPIVGRLKDNTFIYKGDTYQLPQHGFARDAEFICIDQTDDTLVFELAANGQSLEKFPFHFSLQISYTLKDNTLTVNYTVFNPDNYELYFSIGAHPAFNCPLTSEEKYEDYRLVFPSKDDLQLTRLDNGLITADTETLLLENNSLPVEKSLFDKDALVFSGSQVNEVQLRSSVTKHGIIMRSAGWPYFGIWAKKNTEKFICLEPWHGIADRTDTDKDLTKKTGIIKLEPETSFNCSFDITFL